MNNIKTRFRRGTQTIKRKMGKTQKMSDEEYENIRSRTNQQEASLQNFVKHSKQLVENFHAFSATLQFLAEDMRDLYFISDKEQKQLAAKFLDVAQDMEQSGVLPFQTAVQSDIIDGSEEHLAKFSAIKDMHKRRKNLQLDYEAARDRVQFLTSKQSQKNPMELPRAKEKLSHAKESFEESDQAVKAAMQDLLEQRTEVYDPAVSCLLLQLIEYEKQLASISVRIQGDAQHLRNTGGKRSALSGLGSTTMSLSDSFSSLDMNDHSASPAVSRGATPVPNSIPMEFDCDWYYLNQNVEQVGPFGFLDMKKKYKTGEINGQTHVFGGDLNDWATLQDFAKLRRALDS